MSFNGSGTFVINSAGQPVVSGTVISSTAFNALTADLANGLSTCITKDGQTTPTADIPMGSNKITGLANGTAAGDAANLGQVQSTVAKLLGSVSGADTITAVGSPTVAAYAAGQMFYFVAAGANTGAVTINIDSLGAKNITRDGTTALAAGDIQSGEVCVIVYDGTQFQLVNGASQSASIVTENLTVNKATVLNESGGDNDTRIEGDTDANLFFVDASTDRIGVGTDTPLGKLHLTTGSGNTDFYQNVTGTGTASRTVYSRGGAIQFYAGLGAWTGNDTYEIAGASGPLTTLTTSGNLGLGVTPSAWNTAGRAIEVGKLGNAVYSTAANTRYDTSNAFLNSVGDWKYAANGNATLYTQFNGTHAWSTAASGTAGNTISFTQAMTLSANGRLSIGSASEAGMVYINSGAIDETIRMQASGNPFFSMFQGSTRNLYLEVSTDVNFWVETNKALKFGTNNTERARITAGGDLLVGTTNTAQNAGAGLKIRPSANTLSSVSDASTNASNTYHIYSTGAAAYRFYVDYAGTVYATNTTISAISDVRHKENIRDLDVGLDAVMALKPRKFDWKDGKGKNIKNDRGWIAQEFEQVFPDLVDEWLDKAPEGEEPYKSVRQDLIPVLVKAIQELKAELDAAKVKIAALEAK